jgi:hypothetical protein
MQQPPHRPIRRSKTGRRAPWLPPRMSPCAALLAAAPHALLLAPPAPRVYPPRAHATWPELPAPEGWSERICDRGGGGQRRVMAGLSPALLPGGGGAPPSLSASAAGLCHRTATDAKPLRRRFQSGGNSSCSRASVAKIWFNSGKKRRQPALHQASPALAVCALIARKISSVGEEEDLRARLPPAFLRRARLPPALLRAALAPHRRPQCSPRAAGQMQRRCIFTSPLSSKAKCIADCRCFRPATYYGSTRSR